MMHLLTDVSVFLSLDNKAFCQVTGPPLYNYPIPDADEILRPNSDETNFSKRKDPPSLILAPSTKRLCIR